MLDLAFRNITRQRTRTFLTALGIVIGIGAIIALGSISEGINKTVENNLQLVAGKIIVHQKGSGGMLTGFSGSDITDEQVETIKNIDGVEDVASIVFYIPGPLRPFHPPDFFVIGLDPSKLEYFKAEKIGMEEGRELEEGDSEVVIIGKDIADKFEWEVGDFITVKETDFEIIGIIEKSDIEDIDNSIIAPIGDVMNMLDKDTYQMVYVIPENVKDVEIVAERIEDEDDTLETISGKDIARQVTTVMSQIQLFTLGIGGIAAVVGGLGIMNTMIMAVLERRREIGVMKAIGATSRMVLQQILIESALISFIGGIGGLALGIIISLIIGSFAGGMITATVTPQLALIGMGFALLLGIIGGLYPAKKAADLDPVVALRYE
jgi:putative ABC transport system permease protein